PFFSKLYIFFMINSGGYLPFDMMKIFLKTLLVGYISVITCIEILNSSPAKLLPAVYLNISNMMYPIITTAHISRFLTIICLKQNVPPRICAHAPTARFMTNAMHINVPNCLFSVNHQSTKSKTNATGAKCINMLHVYFTLSQILGLSSDINIKRAIILFIIVWF